MPTTTTADGIDVTYERRGDGRPVVLLHGGMAPREYWQPVLPHLDQYAAIVPQRPGFGTCRDAPGETGPDGVLEREVRYVHALIDDLAADPVLFGHSFGALTAIEAATDASVDAVVAYEPAVLPAEFASQADLADRMQARIDAGDPEGAVKRYVEQVVHAGDVDDLDAWLAEWPVWPDCVSLASEVTRMNRAVERYDLPDRLPVDAPALVLTGTAGPDFLRDGARRVHEALPHSRLVDFDGISHSGPAEAPERVVGEMTHYLDS